MKTKPEFRNVTPLMNITRQGGWTFWSMSFTLAVLGFFGYIGMQLVPAYSVNSNIQNAMNQSVEGVNLRSVKRADIIQKINQQLYIDGTHNLLNYKEDLTIKRSRTLLTVQVNYERVIPIAGNINLVVSFDPMVECDFSGKCTNN